MTMTLKYHARPFTPGQRSIVEVGNVTFRRFADGTWQEKIHSGEFHPAYTKPVAKLEAEFQKLPAATEAQLQDW